MTATANSIRLARPDDAEALSELFTRQYDQCKPAAYFIWQFFASPYRSRLAVVEFGGRLVGTFGGIERPLSNRRRAVQVVDMLIAQEFRGKGLFTDLASFCLAGFPESDIAVVLSNRAGTAAITRKLGWTNLGMVPLLLWSPASTHPDHGAVLQDPVPTSAAEGEPPLRLAFVYDPDVVVWRFRQHPVYRYTELQADGAVGWVKTFSPPSQPGRVFGDVLRVSAPGDRPLAGWLRRSQGWCAEQGTESLGLWATPGSAIAAAALESGFRPREQERWFCCQSLRPQSARLADLRLWDICAADAEHY